MRTYGLYAPDTTALDIYNPPDDSSKLKKDFRRVTTHSDKNTEKFISAKWLAAMNHRPI